MDCWTTEAPHLHVVAVVELDEPHDEDVPNEEEEAEGRGHDRLPRPAAEVANQKSHLKRSYRCKNSTFEQQLCFDFQAAAKKISGQQLFVKPMSEAVSLNQM